MSGLILLIGVVVLVFIVLLWGSRDNDTKKKEEEIINLDCNLSNIGVATHCFDVSITENQADETFNDNYTSIIIEPKNKQDDQTNIKDYELEFEYPLDPSVIMGPFKFSESAVRPNFMKTNKAESNRKKGRITMWVYTRGTPSMTMMMSPYIPSLQLKKISSRNLFEPDYTWAKENNSGVGRYSGIERAYVII